MDFKFRVKLSGPLEYSPWWQVFSARPYWSFCPLAHWRVPLNHRARIYPRINHRAKEDPCGNFRWSFQLQTREAAHNTRTRVRTRARVQVLGPWIQFCWRLGHEASTPLVKIYIDQKLQIIDMVPRTITPATAIVESGDGRVTRPVRTRRCSTCAVINPALRIQPVLADISEPLQTAVARFDTLECSRSSWNLSRWTLQDNWQDKVLWFKPEH